MFHSQNKYVKFKIKVSIEQINLNFITYLVYKMKKIINRLI